MPVKVAFLRGSLVAAIGQMPSGPGKPSGGPVAEWDGSAIFAVLAQAQPGDTIGLGWTAVYARPMEAMFGYAKTEAMNWQGHVDYGIQRAKAANP